MICAKRSVRRRPLCWHEGPIGTGLHSATCTSPADMRDRSFRPSREWCWSRDVLPLERAFRSLFATSLRHTLALTLQSDLIPPAPTQTLMRMLKISRARRPPRQCRGHDPS